MWRRRGSQFVQQAVIIALVVLTLVASLGRVSDSLKTVFSNHAQCIADIARGQVGACGNQQPSSPPPSWGGGYQPPPPPGGSAGQ